MGLLSRIFGGGDDVEEDVDLYPSQDLSDDAPQGSVYDDWCEEHGNQAYLCNDWHIENDEDDGQQSWTIYDDD